MFKPRGQEASSTKDDVSFWGGTSSPQAKRVCLECGESLGSVPPERTRSKTGITVPEAWLDLAPGWLFGTTMPFEHFLGRVLLHSVLYSLVACLPGFTFDDKVERYPTEMRTVGLGTRASTE